jgi:transmembrane sensor
MLNRQVIDEAAEWFIEFSTGEPDARMRRAFDAWLRKSPEHVRAYLEMFPIWEDAPRIDPHRTVSAEQLIALSRSTDKNVVHLAPALSQSEKQILSARRRFPGSWYSLVAGVLLAIGVGSWFYLLRDTYTTDIGEQRVITLADGSEVELNARSKIRLEFGDTERRVELIAGQALFRVVKDKRRPFVVESGSTRVRAVGTEFDVYRKRGGTIVTVVEGRVAVHTGVVSQRAVGTAEHERLSSGAGERRVGAGRSGAAPREARLQASAGEILLAAGEQLSVTATSVAKPEHPDVASATAWLQRRLVFSSTPLTEVAEEFNRYNSRQLVIVSPALHTFNVSAVFSATDVPSLLRFLRAQPHIVVEEKDNEIHISSGLSR